MIFWTIHIRTKYGYRRANLNIQNKLNSYAGLQPPNKCEQNIKSIRNPSSGSKQGHQQQQFKQGTNYTCCIIYTNHRISSSSRNEVRHQYFCIIFFFFLFFPPESYLCTQLKLAQEQEYDNFFLNTTLWLPNFKLSRRHEYWIFLQRRLRNELFYKDIRKHTYTERKRERCALFTIYRYNYKYY